MKTTIYLLLICVISINCISAQQRDVIEYFRLDPQEIQPQSSELQEYDVTLKWQNLDAINGTKINCNAVKATYIFGLENDRSAWSDVRLGRINDFRQSRFESVALPAFNDLCYKAMDTSFLYEEFYKNIPPEQRELAKWLVSDALQMQGLAIYAFDSLSYNEEFMPELLDNYDVRFQDWVTFTSRYQKLVWSGISEHNNEICAIVKFNSDYNPIKIDNDELTVEGRALYYGEIWISLEDKQVEYAVMFEDDIFSLKSHEHSHEQLIDLQREIVFNKRNNH